MNIYLYFISSNLQPELLLKRDWDLLAVGAQVTQYSKGDTIITKGADIQHLYFINSGRCSVEVCINFIAL